MLKKIKLWTVLLLVSPIVFAQKSKDKVLLKIDKEKVYASEFDNLFGKNKNLKIQGEAPDINDDIKLFIDYKLKLMEAEELRMDTVPSYLQEVARYRNQLILPYLNDDSLVDSLVLEAYNRSLTEVRASHILVRLKKNSTDTIAAYTKISDIRQSILDGADFSAVAKEKSEDPSAKSNSGDLGYFSVFRMVYPFENAAFSTPNGELSEIFRTQFGYHFLKVMDTRKSMGEMEVAHIMIRDTTSSGTSTIDKVHKELMSGGDFKELAKKYSDDKKSAANGGKLNKFSIGSLPVPFGEISFALTEEEIYSKPFRTAYGWHIVKYLNHYPVGDFESAKEDLTNKTKKDVRSKTLSNPVVLRLRKEYAISINDSAKKEMLDPKFVLVDSLSSWLVTIQKDTLTQKDFLVYTSNRRDKSTVQNFKSFLNQEILEYYKVHLEETDEEFKNIFSEYKNGLLLFDLMKEKIWDAAQNDTIGLKEFYSLNTSNYITPEEFNAVVVRTKNTTGIEALKLLISSADSVQVVQSKVRDMEGVLLKSGGFQRANGIFPENVDLSLGKTSDYQEDGYTVIVKVFSKKDAVQEEYDEIKGKVISDYQNKIQENWIAEIRSKHKVKVYKKTLKKLTSEMDIYSE